MKNTILISLVILGAVTCFGDGNTDKTVQAKYLKNGSAIITVPTVTSTLATTGGSDVLTNKTIDADLNTLSNIDNNEIKASAAIAYSKLNLSSSIVNSDISGSAAIAYSKLNLATSIVNADISTSAAIARSKIASGTANQVVINDGSGNLSGVSPGSSGNVLTSNGTAWVSSSPSAGTTGLVCSAYFATTASCQWGNTNTGAPDPFATESNCPGPTIELSGSGGFGTCQTTDTDLPKVTANSLAAGLYEVMVCGLAYPSGGNINGVLAVSDGTTTSAGRGFPESTSGSAAGGFCVTGYFSYGASGNRTFELYSSTTANTLVVDNQTQLAQTHFVIKKIE